jgi:hypothetical protein
MWNMNMHTEKPLSHITGTDMLGSHEIVRACGRPVPSLIINDLCAQMTTLNRYGLPKVSAALSDGVRALVGASRSAVWSAVEKA